MNKALETLDLTKATLYLKMARDREPDQDHEQGNPLQGNPLDRLTQQERLTLMENLAADVAWFEKVDADIKQLVASKIANGEAMHDLDALTRELMKDWGELKGEHDYRGMCASFIEMRKCIREEISRQKEMA